MENDDIDLNNPIVQVEVLKVSLKHAEEKISQLEETNKQAYITIGRLEAQLKQATDDFHDMRVKLGVTEQKLTHTQQALKQSSQNTTGKNRQTKWRAFLASILFLMTTVLAGVGASMLAASPPNQLGITLIALGAVVYIVAAVLTTLLV